MIEVRGLYKSFGKNQVLRGIDFQVADGTATAVIGPSGSGKTTLLRCMNFLERAEEGTLTIGESTVELSRASRKEALAMRRRTAMVFQQYNLFKNMNALQNVAAGLKIAQKMPKAQATAAAEEALERVGLADKKDAYPSELSGGQQQRVGIARAMALKPEIILFDEPTSALDPELVGEVLEAIRQLAAEGQTMLIVSHEMNFVRKIASQVIFMEGGYIVERGKSEEMFVHPKEERTRQFLQRVTDDWVFII